jgi:chromosome segregation ATPase
MAEIFKFRRQLRGFHREDVVGYIDMMNKKHTSLVNQLKSENKALQEELAALRSGKAAAPAQDEAETSANPELEAYRRAERAERAAKDRAERLYQQAAATLADATAQVDNAAQQLGTKADHVSAQISQLQTAVLNSKTTLQDAVATLAAIRPEEPEE